MTYLDLEPSPVIARTDWPSTVTLPDTRTIIAGDRSSRTFRAGDSLTPCRVTVTARYVHVHLQPGEPATTYTRPDGGALTVRSVYAPPSAPSTVETTDGILSWTPAGGCGCSHPLKRWRPFAGGPQRLGPQT